MFVWTEGTRSALAALVQKTFAAMHDFSTLSFSADTGMSETTMGNVAEALVSGQALNLWGVQFYSKHTMEVDNVLVC